MKHKFFVLMSYFYTCINGLDFDTILLNYYYKNKITNKDNKVKMVDDFSSNKNQKS